MPERCVLERLQDLEDEFVAVEAQLADPAVLADQNAAPGRVASGTRSSTPSSPRTAATVARQADLDAAREMLAEATGDDRELLRAEVARGRGRARAAARTS